ncbi:MAG TPA: hypothetical protein VF529_01550 [Solirubrobacteraceae bacterium]|jgi:hypothetical protein
MPDEARQGGGAGADSRHAAAGVIIQWLLTNPSWVHRRVETAELTDLGNVRRHVSVDFTVPERVPPTGRGVKTAGQLPALPLSLLDKRVLRNLDVRDEDGRAVPVLTTEEDVPIAQAALLAHARGVLEGEPHEDVAAQLRAVAGADRDAARAARRAIEHSLKEETSTFDPRVRKGKPPDPEKVARHDRQKLMSHDYFPGLMRSLARDFILLVDLDALEPGERRIVKYSYEHRIHHVDPHPLRWLAVRLGWFPFKLTLVTPSATKTQSYHCELLPPPGLEFTRARLDPGPGQSSDSAYEDDGGAGRAHVFASGLGWSASPSAVFFMRTLRVGFLRSALMTALLTTGLLFAGRERLTEVSSEVEASATVLLVVPGLLAAYLSRSGEHALASSMLVGVRLMLLVAGLCALACGALLVAHVQPEDLKYWWTALSILSAVALAVVSFANFLPLMRYKSRDLRDDDPS